MILDALELEIVAESRPEQKGAPRRGSTLPSAPGVLPATWEGGQVM